MKRVKMRTLSAGPDGVFPAGSIKEVSDEQAKQLIRAGYAEGIKEPKEKPKEPEKPKTVMAAPDDEPEDEVRKNPPPRRRRSGAKVQKLSEDV